MAGCPLFLSLLLLTWLKCEPSRAQDKSQKVVPEVYSDALDSSPESRLRETLANTSYGTANVVPVSVLQKKGRIENTAGGAE